MLTKKHQRKINESMTRVLAGHPNKSKLDVAMQTVEPHLLMQHHRPHGSGLNLAGSKKAHRGTGLTGFEGKSSFMYQDKAYDYSHFADHRTTLEYSFMKPLYSQPLNTMTYNG